MSRCSIPGGQAPWRAWAGLMLLGLIGGAPAWSKTPDPTAPPRSALGGFVKDAALARVLGETLFKDTVAVMSDAPGRAASAAPPAGDKSAVGQVARTVLARQSLDKYLWLIRQSFDDSLWKGGDRSRIEQHFPLIWRTSILLYESTLNPTPHRVRVCVPTDEIDVFDCHDEIERARIVPIPAQAPMLGRAGQPEIG